MTAIPHIKVLVLDVDGVLTDGKIALTGHPHGETKYFHVHDGLGISLWQKAGFHTIIISGRNSQCVDQRADELQIQHVKQGSIDKVADINLFLQQLGYSPKDACFVGDDLGDIPVMQHVGYSIAVQDAAEEVKAIANWTTKRMGGCGAVRDAIEHLMKANKSWDKITSTIAMEHANQ
jgi:3-deoxy-D-manno-octulosonate 8-phosphate phosphatase (KDO 8-P phosphatase)